MRLHLRMVWVLGVGRVECEVSTLSLSSRFSAILPSPGLYHPRSDLPIVGRESPQSIVMLLTLLGATAFGPSAVWLPFSHPRAHVAMVESVDVSLSGDDVLETLLDQNADTGMRRQMAEGLRLKQLAIAEAVGKADGVDFQGARCERA